MVKLLCLKGIFDPLDFSRVSLSAQNNRIKPANSLIANVMLLQIVLAGIKNSLLFVLIDGFHCIQYPVAGSGAYFDKDQYVPVLHN